MKSNEKDTRWVNGVPFSIRTPDIDDEQAWKYYLEVTKLTRKKAIEKIHKKWNGKIL